VTKSDQFIRKIGNDSLGPAIKPRRHALHKRRDLSNFQGYHQSGRRARIARIRLFAAKRIFQAADGVLHALRASCQKTLSWPTCNPIFSNVGLVDGAAGLTSEQRPIFASSDVDASASDLQNQLENLIGPSTVYRRVPMPTITTAAST
jgi:hypothetical protein